MKKVLLALLAVVLAAGMSTALASPAQAKTKSSTKVGYTQVVVDPAVYDLIAGAGITPAPTAGAKAGAFKDTIAARFPISGYRLGKLRIKHTGGLNLSAGPAATITVSDFNIDLGRLRVSGKVNGTVGNVGRVDLFKVRASNRLGYGVVRLTLTKTAADALNATFGVDAFAENATFGYATPKPFSRF